MWSGPTEGPAVVVLDPGGEARHSELPATWRPLARHVHVVWCRLPAEVGGEATPEDVLTALTQRSARVHLVASGVAAQEALRLALEHAAAVRTVIAVDPAPPRHIDPQSWVHTPIEWWDRGTALERERLSELKVLVRCFVSRETDTAVRVDRPIPLGHPDVVGRLVETLLSFEQPPPAETDPTGHLPAIPVEAQRRRGVADAWREVREHEAEPIRRARESGRESGTG